MRKTSRREFLALLGATGAGLLAGKASGAVGVRAIDDAELGMLYDATRCVGCKACMVACKRVNRSLGDLSYEQAPFDPDRLWDAPSDLSGNTRTVIKLYKKSSTRWSYVKYSCMHCQEPSCVSVCPVSAMTKDKVTGVVVYDKDKCIGCRYCMVACAFDIPRFQWERKSPQIVKCDMCNSTNLRRKRITACAEVCPVGAITFGKRGDLVKDARGRISASPDRYVNHIYGEKELGGTNHLYLAGIPFGYLGLRDFPDKAPVEFSEHIQHAIYHDFIAPVGLYAIFCLIALLNRKKVEKTGIHQEEE